MVMLSKSQNTYFLSVLVDTNFILHYDGKLIAKMRENTSVKW